MRMTNERLAYLAGLLDGEGSILLIGGKDDITASVSAISTTVPMMANTVQGWLVESGWPFRLVTSRSENPKHKSEYCVMCTEMETVRSFLKSIREYIILKRPQADIVLEFLSNRGIGKRVKYSHRDYELKRIIKAMNKRGPKDTVETDTQSPRKKGMTQSELFSDKESAAETTVPLVQ
jgi:hypothetical protein